MSLSLDFASLADLYESGAATSEDVVREVYRRIRMKGVRPDWITLVDERMALAAARVAPPGPLFGLPYAVKDNIDVAGLETTCACPEFAYVAERSAFVVEKLAAAGAILIGKTNLDQFATGLNGTRSPYGVPASSFNPDYIAGGSSSGSAVVVASGLVSFSLGTDTAGSGRVPAAFNNIVGLKPSKGRISMTGVVPACRTQDTVSIFALTVRDAAKVAETTFAYDSEDSFARRGAAPFRLVATPDRLRVGIPQSETPFFGDGEYQALYHAAVTRIIGLGAEIIGVDYAPFAAVAEMLYDGPWVAERLVAAGGLLKHNPMSVHPVLRDILHSAERKTALHAFQSFYGLADAIRDTAHVWDEIDVLMLPTAGTTFQIAEMRADPIALNAKLGAYTNFVNLMDLAAIAVPGGFRSDGIPFGVTLIGPALSDGMLASVGDALHRSLDDAKLGATPMKLSSIPPLRTEVSELRKVRIAVVGAHLSGQPLNCQLIERDAKLVETTRTARGYSLYALAETTPPKPGLVFDGAGVGEIEIEIWEMDQEALGSFIPLIKAPLGIGTLTLADGRTVQGFLCEAHAVKGASDITSYGGWRNWLANSTTALAQTSNCP